MNGPVSTDQLTSAQSPDWAASDAKAAQQLALDLTTWNHPQVRGLPPKSRTVVAGALASAVNAGFPPTELSTQAKLLAGEMKQDGVVRLGSLLTRPQCNDIEAYFRARPCYNLHYEGHIRGDRVPRMVDSGAAEFEFGSYPRDEILRAPHLVEALTSDLALDVAQEYLGATPMMFSINVYWSFPGQKASYGQDYHRDISHPNFCVLFLYLTDVDADSGAHQYIRRTHTVAATQEHLQKIGKPDNAEELFSLPMDGLGFTDRYEACFSDLVDTISGPAGTAFIEDTYGLHRGFPPRNAPRLAAWARYSLFPTAPALDKSDVAVLGGRYPAGRRNQYALRGILK